MNYVDGFFSVKGKTPGTGDLVVRLWKFKVRLALPRDGSRQLGVMVRMDEFGNAFIHWLIDGMTFEVKKAKR